jgi:HD-GYP domain-containing protein (c-di-GMP phosphodiesterase class II)
MPIAGPTRCSDHLDDRDPREAAIAALSALSFVLNPVMTMHQEATGLLAARIARTLTLDETTIFRIEMVGRIHDIGLNGVDPRIIDKQDLPTDYEYDILRLHSERGAAILMATPCLAEWAPIIRSHHERVDGSGYPDRLSAFEIPIESRILAVADGFHAMTTPQHWREAMSPFAAVRELARCAGSQYDQEVVAALVRTLGIRHAEKFSDSA